MRSTNKALNTIKINLNGVQVAPFGPKLCQNDATELRIILEASPGPKNLLKNTKIQIFRSAA